MAARTSATSKAAPKKAAAKKPAPAKKASAAKKAPAKKTAVKKTTAKKAAPTKTTPAKKAPAKKATSAKKTVATKKTAATKTATTKATPAKKSPAVKATAKKTPTKAASKKAAEKPVKAEASEAFTKKFLEAQHEALVEQRATYDRQARSLRAEAASLVEDFQSGDVQFDEESGEGDTLNVAREQDLMMSSQALNAIEEIDHALAKFASGTYGICEVSGKAIPKARLEAIPWARERVEYKVGGLTSR